MLFEKKIIVIRVNFVYFKTGSTISNCLGVAAWYGYFSPRMTQAVSKSVTTVFEEQPLALPGSALYWQQKKIYQESNSSCAPPEVFSQSSRDHT